MLASAAALAAGCAMETDEPAPSPPAAATATPGPDEPVALVGAQVWRERRLEPVTVVVVGERIEAVLPPGPADGVRAVDLSGATLLPGFVDCHVHLQFSSPEAILAGGVTAVRDLGSPAEVREAAAGSPLTAVVAGRILTAVGGYPTRSWGGRGESREVRDADDARAAVDEQLAEGATVIKVALEPSGGPLPEPEVVAAVVAAARAAGVRVTAHVGSAAALDLALEVGVDELAHLPLHDVTEAEVLRIAEAEVVVCPTLAIRGEDPGARRAVEAFVEAGGTVVYGSDLGNGGTAPGIMVDEVRALLASGLSPGDVVECATSAAAAHLGLDGRGRIEPGAIADLVAVAGDPLADPAAYADVRLVLAAGRPVRGVLG